MDHQVNEIAFVHSHLVMSKPVGILCIKKAVAIVILIVDVRNVVVVIVVVVHVVPEAVPISVPVQVLGGKDNAKDGKEEEDGQEEFVRTHYDLL